MSHSTQRTDGNSSRPTYGATMMLQDTVKSTKAGVNINSSGEVEVWDKVGTVKKAGGLYSALTAAGSAVTNTVTETVAASFTVPANTIKAGTLMRVSYQGIATATNGTDTLRVRLRFGGTTLTGTVLLDHTAIDVANDSFFSGYFDLIGRAAPGAAAAIVGMGMRGGPGTTSAASNMVNAMLATTNFATNAALLVEVTLQWSVANAGNSARVDCLNGLIFG